MLQSKFKLIAYFIPLFVIIFLSLCIYILINNLPIAIEQIRWIDVYVTVLFTFTIIMLIFGEIRTKFIKVTISDRFIEKKNYLGFNKQYSFKDFDGYQTSIVKSYEYLYLVKNGEKIIKISAAYHKNYVELKSKIATLSNNLGEIRFSYIDDIKEIFK